VFYLKKKRSFQTDTPDIQNTQSLHDENNNKQIFFATAVVTIKDKFAIKHFPRALLDSGSQVNFITEDLSQKLYLPSTPDSSLISGNNNNNANNNSNILNFKLTPSVVLLLILPILFKITYDDYF